MNATDTGIRHLERPEGRIAFTDRGTGPAVVLAPGMGDTRDVYDALADALVAAGFRAIVTDIRGHGDSDTGFRRFGDAATAGDLLALLDVVGEPAVLVGNSFAGSAAVIAAAERPEAVTGLVLVSPFLDESQGGLRLALLHLLFRAMFARPWGAAAWTGYYARTLNRGAESAALAPHVAALRASFADPARLAQFRALAGQLDHREVAGCAARVTAPALVVVGALDPDYPDPAAALASMGAELRAETLLVPDAGHYAHAQRPEIVTPRILSFLASLGRGENGIADA